MPISNVLRRALTVALNPSAAHRELIALLNGFRAGDLYFVASEAIAEDQIVTPIGASGVDPTVALAEIWHPGPFYVARETVAAGEVIRCGINAILPIDTTVVILQNVGFPVFLDPLVPGGSTFLGGGRVLGTCLTTGASGTYLFDTRAGENFRALGIVDEVFYNDTGGVLDGGDWMERAGGGTGLMTNRLMDQGAATVDGPETTGVLLGDTADEAWGVVRRQGVVTPATMAPLAALWTVNVAGSPALWSGLQKHSVAGQAATAGADTERIIGVSVTVPASSGVEVRCRG